MTVAPATIAELQDCIKDAAAVALRGASTKADSCDRRDDRATGWDPRHS